MNTHSCSQPQLCPNSTVEKLRAGLTDVLSIGIVTMWIRASMSPIGMPAKPAIAEDRVVPAITRMNSAVNTTSVITTAQKPKCDGEWSAKPFDAAEKSAWRLNFLTPPVPMLSPLSMIPQRITAPRAAPRI